MVKSPVMPIASKTWAVDIGGALLLLPVLPFVLGAVLGLQNLRGVLSIVFASLSVIVAMLIGYGALATIGRWPGWRNWAGALSWSLIALALYGFFWPFAGTPAERGGAFLANVVFLMVSAFVLWAKRREARLHANGPKST